MQFTHIKSDVELKPLSRVTLPTHRVYTSPAGEMYPSVTTVLGSQKNAGLDAWRKRVGESAANGISRQAANNGEIVHKLCEDYINNDPLWNKKKGVLPIHIFNFNIIKNVLDTRLNNVRHQEAPLYSDYLKTAGTVDCIAEFDGVLSIIDFKTSKRIKKREHITNYFMQEAFYAVAYEELTGIPIRQLVTIITSVEGAQVVVEDRNDHIHKFIEVRNAYVMPNITE